ncbi:MAG: alpha/beta fold hydrolase [Erysipelotrichaceae bacterium]|jgi:2-hydroxymuconate-semialdehyde hydrolase|nr:alpha/beta fold hydrolase [Erysipelotrichaceae bacterium]
MSNTKPEIAFNIKTGAYSSNYHEYGKDTKTTPIIFVHGSGPGVTSWANWSKILPVLGQDHHVLALDMVGFGYSDRPEGIEYTLDGWIDQVVAFADAKGIEKFDLVGNSFGGSIALGLAVRFPHRVRKIVLMGAMGVDFSLTYGLDSVWGYTPSFENMRAIINIFAYNRKIVTDALTQMRYEASIEPGFQESFSAMFPAPRQRWVKAQAKYEAQISDLDHPTLIVHGREDLVIPVENSIRIFRLMKHAQLHIFSECGHWTQIEQTDRFIKLVRDFVDEA